MKTSSTSLAPRCRPFLGLCLALTTACAGRIPLPEHLRVDGTAALLAKMAAARSPLASFSAEVRLTYFGAQGRLKGTATLVARRPGSFRYDLYGPHGGVVLAFATNGAELQVVDFKESRFVHGPATAANIDRLLQLAPLHLGPEGWVGLLFGEVPVPETAVLAYDDRSGRFVLTWTEADQTRVVEVDPATAKITRAAVRQGETPVSEVSIEARDAHGLPEALRLRAAAGEADVEVRLRDVTADPELDDGAFHLDPPRGVAPEHLPP